MLTNRQSQLRSTRDTNISLMKNVTIVMNKCIQRLKKKLDEVNHNTTPFDKDCDNIRIQVQLSEDHDDYNKVKREDNLIEDEVILTEDQNLIRYEMVDNDDDKNIIKNQDSIRSSIMDTTIQNQRLIYDKSIPIQPIDNDPTYMNLIWSQNHPSTCPLFQHSTFLSNPIFPLHPPIASPEKLGKMIQIAQTENILQREEIIEGYDGDDGGNTELLERQYRNAIEGTCLDIYTCSQYDPFYVSLLPEIMKECDNRKDEDNTDNDQSKDGVDETNNTEQESNVVFNQNQKIDEIDNASKLAVQGENDNNNNSSDTIAIDPNKIFCKYELLGSCHDPTCTYQHLNKDLTNPKKRRVVHKKGSNKITVGTKTITSKRRITCIYDHVVSLPPLTLPLLPSTFPKMMESNIKSSRNSNNGNSMDLEPLQNYVLEQHDDETHSNSEVAEEESDRSQKSVADDCMNIKKRKSDSISRQDSDDNEEDFIGLPPDDEESELHVDDDSSSGEDSVDNFAVVNDVNREDMNVHFEPKHLYDSLKKFNFEVRKRLTNESEIHDQHPDDCFEVLYQGNVVDVALFPNSHDDNINPISLVMNALIFLANGADAIRLCVFSGRLDICRAIIELAFAFLNQSLNEIVGRYTSTVEENLKSFFNIADLIMNDLKKFSDGSFCGRGSISYSSDFHVQLGLSMISYYIRFCQQYILEEESLDLRNSVADFQVEYYNDIIAMVLGLKIGFIVTKESMYNDDKKHNERFETMKLNQPPKPLDDQQSHILDSMVRPSSTNDGDAKTITNNDNATINDTHVPSSSTAATTSTNQYAFPSELLPKCQISFSKDERTPWERFSLIKQCFLSGQLLARKLAHDIFISGQFDDAQLILDGILCPLCNLMQNHVASYKSSVAADVIHNALTTESRSTYESVGLPTQLCTFAIYAPSVLVTFSGIFLSLKASEDKDSFGFKGGEFDSRHQGILVATKNMIMTFIQLFDQSGITGETFEGQLLLSPMFSMMTNILLNQKSYAKAQVLVENALYGSSNNPRIWSIYSESLWSSLVQLRMSFPLQSNHKANPKPGTLDNDLARVPLLYGLNLTKVNLSGDSSFVQSAYFYRNDLQRGNSTLEGLRNVCLLLSTRTGHSQYGRIKDLRIRFARNSRLCVSFPLSIMLAGTSIQSLTFYGGNLKDLPKSFGIYLGTLEVSFIFELSTDKCTMLQITNYLRFPIFSRI